MQTTIQNHIRQILRSLGFAPHHTGYKLLIAAILLYMQDNSMSITKEIYPTIAKQSPLYSAANIERSIRYAISEAWANGTRSKWSDLFPQLTKAPSNMVFISLFAEHLR